MSEKEKVYRVCNGVPFGTALEAMKNGQRVARKGWNGKNMYLDLQVGSTVTSENARGGAVKVITEESFNSILSQSHIDLRNANGFCSVGWSPSQEDMLSNDWFIIDDKGDS